MRSVAAPRLAGVVLSLAVALAGCGRDRASVVEVPPPPESPDAGSPCDGCTDGQVCYAGACCSPSCAPDRCGDDGCGGACECRAGWLCNLGTSACECSAQTDEALCAEHGVSCGPLSTVDACGAVRDVACDRCLAPTTCRPTTNRCECDPEPEKDFCARQRRVCSTVTAHDLCGELRTVDCGRCGEGERCSDDGTRCDCVPESDGELCVGLAAECGGLAVTDRCGAGRTVDCGQCAGDLACGDDHRCHCTPETDAALCARNGKQCGPLLAMDNCGARRSVAECGPCASGTGCTWDAQCEACTPESDEQFCARLNRTCGPWRGLDDCRRGRSVADCGRCTSPATCQSNGTCGLPPTTRPTNFNCDIPEQLQFNAMGEASLIVDSSGAAPYAASAPGPRCGSMGSERILYAFTTSGTTDIDITLTSLDAGGLPGFHVRSVCDDVYSQLGCAVAPSPGATASLSLTTVPQGTYFLWVSTNSPYGTWGAAHLVVAVRAAPPPPENDSCYTATPLRFVGSVAEASGTTRGADSASSGICIPNSGPEVLYTFTLPAAALVRVLAQGRGGFTPSVYVRDGCSMAPVEYLCRAGRSGAALASSRNLAAGTYYVFVDSADQSFGDYTLRVTKGPALTNDTCADVETLSVDPATGIARTMGDVTGAADDYEPYCILRGGPIPPAADVVYALTVPPGPSPMVTIEVMPAAGSQLEPLVSVRTACAATLGYEYACQYSYPDATPDRIKFPTLAPGTYFVWVEGVAGSEGAFDLTATLQAPQPAPVNDACAGAVDIALDPTSHPRAVATGTTVNAASDYSDPCFVWLSSGGDVVYRITLGATSLFSAKVTRAATTPYWSPGLYLRTACLGNLLAGDCEWKHPNPKGQSWVWYNELPAGTYFLSVDGLFGSEGDFVLELGADAPVSNYTCATAKRLVPDPATHSTTVVSTNEFSTSTDPQGCEQYVTPQTVFSFTVSGPQPADATVIVTPPDGSLLVPNVVARRVCSQAGSDLACVSSNPLAPAGTPVQVDLRHLAPGDYFLFVGGVSGSMGAFDITLTLVDSPPLAANDTCAGAEAIPIDQATGVGTATGTTTRALNDLGPSCRAGTGADLVYTFDLLQASEVEVAIRPAAGSRFSPAVSARGGCLDPMTELGCAANGAGGRSVLRFPRLPMRSYTIVVDSYSPQAEGAFEVRVTTSPPLGAAPANDTCAAATPMVLGPVIGRMTVSGDTTYATNDAQSQCAQSTARLSGPDVFYRVTIPGCASLTAKVTRGVTSTTFRPAVSIRSSCAPADELACAVAPSTSDSASVTLPSLPAGDYWVVVDGVQGAAPGSGYGPFTLEVLRATSTVPCGP